MVNKYHNKSKKPKCEPVRKECAKQREIEDKSLELKIFNYLKNNLEIQVEDFRNNSNAKVHVVKICLTNPITGEIEEIEREYL